MRHFTILSLLFFGFVLPCAAQDKAKPSPKKSAKSVKIAKNTTQNTAKKTLTKEEIEKTPLHLAYQGKILAYPNGIFGVFPDNIAVGKCYKKIRYWCGNNCPESVTEMVLVRKDYKTISITPAETKEINEKIKINEAVSFTISESEAEQLRTKKDTNALLSLYFAKSIKNILVMPADTVYSLIPAKFKVQKRRREIVPNSTKWQQWHIKNCKSSLTPECEVSQLVETPAEYEEVMDTTVIAPEQVSNKVVAAKFTNISVFNTQKSLKTSANGVEISLPARFRSLTKTVIIRKAQRSTVEHPAVYSSINIKKIAGKDGCCSWLERWFEVPCADFEKNLQVITYPVLLDTAAIYTAAFQKPSVTILSKALGGGGYPMNPGMGKCYQQFYIRKSVAANSNAENYSPNFYVKGKWVDYKIKNCSNGKSENCIIRKLEDDATGKVNVLEEAKDSEKWELQWFEIPCNAYPLEDAGF
jgi:hypothetical protein